MLTRTLFSRLFLSRWEPEDSIGYTFHAKHVLDATGLHRVRDIVDTMRRRQVRVLFVGLNAQVAGDLREAGIADNDVLFATLEEAIQAAEQVRKDATH